MVKARLETLYNIKHRIMCGIVGYIGTRQAFPILMDGLKKLEYRGYDSAGVALLHDGELHVIKTKGKVSNLENLAADNVCQGTIGIAHTRWATHGEPSAVNAHPHVSMSVDLAIVHNGIIENYQTLKEQLISNLQEVKSRNGRILAIVTEGDQQVKALANQVIEIPATLNALVPLLSVVPLQILAYYVAVYKGLNVDMPRNLAKSVTVE